MLLTQISKVPEWPWAISKLAREHTADAATVGSKHAATSPQPFPVQDRSAAAATDGSKDAATPPSPQQQG